MSKPLRIGIAGLGTVGGGTLKILSEHGDMLASRCGRTRFIISADFRPKIKTSIIPTPHQLGPLV